MWKESTNDMHEILTLIEVSWPMYASGNTCSSASSVNLEQKTGDVTVRRYNTLGGRQPLETLSQADSCEKCKKERTAAISDQPVAVASTSLKGKSLQLFEKLATTICLTIYTPADL